jgi:hypothetical protein
MARAAAQPGRVLRVKLGYNPNSSSIGSAIPSYLLFAAGSGILGALLLHLTGSVAALLRRTPASEPSAPPAPRPPESSGDAQPPSE